MEIMYEKEFVWIVANDDNRIQDGRDLRNSYLDTIKVEDRRDYKSMHRDPVSFLEVLVALSKRVAFIVSGNPNEWAWKLIENLGLHRMYDQLTERKADRIHEVLDAVIWRTYEVDGNGGFFPLILPNRDQTEVEIWYQMSAYIEERRTDFDL
jgi:CRISPR/Cas system-associated protein Cas10 (large subunit of type III CRISPR-Cas system)